MAVRHFGGDHHDLSFYWVQYLCHFHIARAAAWAASPGCRSAVAPGAV